MDDIAEIGPANHLEYEKRQEKERIQRDTIRKVNAFILTKHMKEA